MYFDAKGTKADELTILSIEKYYPFEIEYYE
jgi:hypothetical protein